MKTEQQINFCEDYKKDVALQVRLPYVLKNKVSEIVQKENFSSNSAFIRTLIKKYCEAQDGKKLDD